MTTIGRSPEMTLPPERALTLAPAAETRRRRSQLGLGKDDERRQLLKGLHVAGANAKPAHLDLGVGPGGLEGAHTGVKLRVTLRPAR